MNKLYDFSQCFLENTFNVSWKRTFETKENIGMNVLYENKNIIGIIYDMNDDLVFAKIDNEYRKKFFKPFNESFSIEIAKQTKFLFD